MARSFKICVQDDKGRPIACAWCRAFKSTDNTEVETQYTDGSGNATFVALTDNVDCYIMALWGVQSKFFFSEATIGKTEIEKVSVFGSIDTDVVPALDNTYYLGASDKYWASCYLNAVYCLSLLQIPIKTTTGDPQPVTGMIYINTYDKKVRIYNGSAWVDLGTWV